MTTATTTQRTAAPPVAADFALSPKFWAQFTAEHWGQQPLLLKQPFQTPLADETEVFRGIVAASDRFRAGERDLPLQFFNEQGLSYPKASAGAYYPAASDQTIAGYAARITRQLDGQRFAFVLNGVFLAHAPEVWLRVRALLRGLFDQLAPHDVYSAIFLGNYERTPFGVHQDDKSNFQFVIAGRKQMHLWPDEFAQATPPLRGTLDYQHFLADGLTLTAEPGDVMFWPSSSWHIGSSGAGLSVCLTIGLRPFASPYTEVWQHLAENIQERIKQLRYANAERGVPDSRAAISTIVELVTQTARETEGDTELAQAFQTAWLKRLSNGGPVDRLEPLPPRALAGDEIIRGAPEAPILWQRAPDQQAIVAVNGHVFGIPADPNILRLFERLNSGAELRVQSLMAEHTGTTQTEEAEFEATPAGLCALLEKLYSLRALTACG